MRERKKILFHSNYHGQLTGFGKNCRNVLSWIFSLGKYEIVELANGYRKNDPIFQFSPWKVIGTISEDENKVRSVVENLCAAVSSPEEKRNMEEAGKRRIFYGDSAIDDIIYEEKPDFYLSVEDIWAMSPYIDKPWWNKFPCAVWTTLDSLPILPEAIKVAQHTPHFFCWADFATQELHKIGLKHVKTIHGALKTEDFYRLSEPEKKINRLKHGLDFEFLVGFVFRNQSRKTIHCLFDALSLFKKRNPKTKAKALIVTNWAEGWPLPKLIEESGLTTDDVLTPFVCNNCSSYKVSPFYSNKIDCENCGAKESCSTVSITKGLTEAQLNEVYNLMDVYAHPFNSGGQEIPIQEAKLAELITLITNYSCGTEGSTKESGGLPIKWAETREFGSCFKKAVTDPNDLCQKLELVYSFKDEKKREIGANGRKFVLDNYSIAIVCEKLMQVIDSSPSTNFWEKTKETYTLNPEFIPTEKTPQAFVEQIYKFMLGEPPNLADPNYEEAIRALNAGQPFAHVLEQFRVEALNRKNSLNEIQNQIADTLVIVNGSFSSACKAKALLKKDKRYHIFCPDLFKTALLDSNIVFINTYDKKLYKEIHEV